MKISKGRGIQFFKLPSFKGPQKFVVDTYNVSKNKFSGFAKFGKKKNKNNEN